MSVLEIAAFALSGCSVLMLTVLVTRRFELARRVRRRGQLEDGLKEFALELLHSGGEPPEGLSGEEKEALADLLGRYARRVSGPMHERIVEYFARDGTIERELAVLAEARRSWRRATAAFRLGDIGSAAATAGLIEALRDDDREVPHRCGPQPGEAPGARGRSRAGRGRGPSEGCPTRWFAGRCCRSARSSCPSFARFSRGRTTGSAQRRFS